MKKYILEYMNITKSFIKDSLDKASIEEINSFVDEMNIKIMHFQHERLIHLIVTVLFALLEVIGIVAMVVSPSLVMIILSALFLVLLIPYVFHYYFLENSVQELYKLRDTIVSKLK